MPLSLVGNTAIVGAVIAEADLSIIDTNPWVRRVHACARALFRPPRGRRAWQRKCADHGEPGFFARGSSGADRSSEGTRQGCTTHGCPDASRGPVLARRGTPGRQPGPPEDRLDRRGPRRPRGLAAQEGPCGEPESAARAISRTRRAAPPPSRGRSRDDRCRSHSH